MILSCSLSVRFKTRRALSRDAVSHSRMDNEAPEVVNHICEDDDSSSDEVRERDIYDFLILGCYATMFLFL